MTQGIEPAGPLPLAYRHTDDIVADARLIVEVAQQGAYRAVNTALVQRNWLLGRRIAEEELAGEARAAYGTDTVGRLAGALTEEYGKGFSSRALYQCLAFYRAFPGILQTPSAESRPMLTWSHYVELLRVDDSAARAWYEREAASGGWSVRTLARNISTQYYHRLLASQGAEPARRDEARDAGGYRADKLEFIKNPVIAEFLNLPSDPSLRESDLEAAILSNLQQFLLEMGKGYAFMARQQHIRTDAGDYFIDLVFYNVILKCYVLIDLKVGQISHQDVGQMDMYVRMYDELRRQPDDNPTLGIVLCSETSADIARYSILNGSEQLFASKYKLYLPTEEELRAEIEAQAELWRQQHAGTEERGEKA